MSMQQSRIGALILLQLAASLGHLGEATTGRRRRTRHTYPSPEPTSEPAATAATAVPGGWSDGDFADYVFDTHENVWIGKASSPPIADATSAPETPTDDAVTADAVTTDAKKSVWAASSTPPIAEATAAPETPKHDAVWKATHFFDASNNVWKAVSTPPVAETASALETPPDDAVIADAAAIGSMINDQSDMEGMEATQSESTAAPIYALRHGRGIFAIASGTGCYEGAKGQAQARFGVATADVDLFVPSVFEMLQNQSKKEDFAPHDTVLNEFSSDNHQRRLDVPAEDTTAQSATTHICDVLHSGKHSFNQISIRLERRSSPTPDGSSAAVKDSSSSYHHHGSFQAKEEWFDGLDGEYSLECIHHECILGLYFGIGASAAADCEADSCDTIYEKGVTSLKLQGTTELAYQGADPTMLACVENCGGDDGHAVVDIDTEHAEMMTASQFDSSAVQVQTSHSTEAPKTGKGKAAKTAKTAKGELYKCALRDVSDVMTLPDSLNLSACVGTNIYSNLFLPFNQQCCATHHRSCKIR
jgi:hypothetical protein